MPPLSTYGTTGSSKPQGGDADATRRLLRQVAERDAAWFAHHPRSTHYIRRAIPHEFGPARVPAGLDAWVLVTQVVPGRYLREPVALLHRVGSWLAVLDTSGAITIGTVDWEDDR